MRSLIYIYINIIIGLISQCCDSQGDNELIVRNPYGLKNFVESEHFVIYWGEGVDASLLTPILDNLEFSWQVLIEQKGFRNPPTTDINKLNVYLSGTGQVPHNDVKGGYAILDDQGHEAIILHKDHVNDLNAQIIGPTHEFFHTIQSGYGLIYSDAMQQVSWLAEATANWSVTIVWPDSNEIIKNSLASFAFYPQYGIDHDNPTKAGQRYELLPGRHYGSFILFNHLVDATQDEAIVRTYFEYLKPIISETKSKHALVELINFLTQQYGLSFSDVFLWFVERNAIWDYQNQSDIKSALEDRRASHADEHITRLHSNIENQWNDAVTGTLPRRWGANYIQLSNPNTDMLEIGFEGNAYGSGGNPGDWRVSVVVEFDDGPQYTELMLRQGKIENSLISVDGASAVWLAIMVTSNSLNFDQVFSYRYQFAMPGQSQVSPGTEIDYEEDSPNDKSGSGSLTLLLLGMVLILKREQS